MPNLIKLKLVKWGKIGVCLVFLHCSNSFFKKYKTANPQ